MNPVDEGTPQGGPLSPLLSNIVLDEFDRELERRGLRFARYADDSNIYVRSKRAGERVMESLKGFLMTKLKLRVNEQKSAVARPWERKFLGFSFTNGFKPKRRIAPKAVDRFEERVRELTSRTRGVSTERMAEELTRYLRGWLGYFGKCETPSVLEGLEQWFRRRLRSAVWKQWKKGHGAVRRTPQAGCWEGSRRSNGWKFPRSVEDRGFTGTPYCTAQCLLRLARDSEVDGDPMTQPAEPPDADPACPVVWEGRSREASPYPD